MTPIHFEVTGSNVKVTVAFNAKIVSTQYLEKFMGDSHYTRIIGHTQQMTPINFKISRSNVKVTVAFNAKTMSPQYLEKFMSDSHGTWLEDWSYSVDEPYTF